MADSVILERIKRSGAIFLKYVNLDTGMAKTEFLATKCIDDPCGANAEVITDHILDTLKECDLEVRNLKSFVSDDASVMTGEHNGVAARLKKLQEDIKPEGRFGGLELTITDNDKKILGNLLSAFVSGLAKNITSRFNDCLSVLSSFSILSPVALPKPTSPEFKEYGNKEIKILADHFFKRRK